MSNRDPALMLNVSPEMKSALEYEARQAGVSVAEYVRGILGEDHSRESRWRSNSVAMLYEELVYRRDDPLDGVTYLDSRDIDPLRTRPLPRTDERRELERLRRLEKDVLDRNELVARLQRERDQVLAAFVQQGKKIIELERDLEIALMTEKMRSGAMALRELRNMSPDKLIDEIMRLRRDIKQANRRAVVAPRTKKSPAKPAYQRLKSLEEMAFQLAKAMRDE